MPSDYLLKTEPSENSFADLQGDDVTQWDGVPNPVAVKNLREMKPVARLVIDETGDRKSAVGTASVVSLSSLGLREDEEPSRADRGTGSFVPVTSAARACH